MLSTDREMQLADLLAAIRDGDPQAEETFFRRYEPMLRRVLRVTRVIRWLQSQVNSQDLVQSVFIEVFAKVRADSVQFGNEAKLEAFLKKVGKNRLRDHIRRLKAAKRARQRTVSGNQEALAEIAKHGPSPSEIADLREQVARVEKCTSPEDLKVLREQAEGRKWAELAAEHEMTPEALRARIARVRQRIRDNLGE